ncbi:hypothetical protein E3N88_00937 [Mikania micrantha]|uniref:Uncharacterized protein n=1 Tax=Mikania micrantha TaxID=192012 RepID=A0A5N6Q1G2_9ASTR|nr:hypothetical protein E3N88_00937 [Mikania micrantha]
MWASNADNPPLTNNEMFDALDDVIGEQNTYEENVNEYGDGLDTEKENSLMQNCPDCNKSIWVDKNTKGKKVAQKVLRYFPLTSHLRQRFSSRFTAKDMIWHNTGRSTDGMMRHPVDGKVWQEFDNRYPNFAKEPRNVRLGLAADGINPFGNMSQTYSMWPVVLTTYNTPP